MKSCLGELKITEKQAQKLALKPNTRLSPWLEKCCLRLVASESFENAEVDVEMTTGVKVSRCALHRLVLRESFVDVEATSMVDALSVDGGKVRLRTEKGKACEWRDYKAITLHGQVCAAFFQANNELIDWVNAQPLSRMITCVGDGHEGVWNLIKQVGFDDQRREVLDWYHLVENLHKIGGSNKFLKKIENYLWSGQIDLVFEELAPSKRKQVVNFRTYLHKHRERIPDYSLYQDLGICIGSGSVESTIKRIGLRIKISGAQWKSENVPQYLKLRCAYLNGMIA